MSTQTGKKATFDGGASGALAANLQLKEIETQIGVYMRGAYQNILAVGRCLNDAKDRKLVPHGSWAQWVREQTGMAPREAQIIMQQAREIPEGSQLERLGITKIRMLLALPEDEREEFAQSVRAQDITSRQLRDAVQARKILEGRVKDLTREKELLGQDYQQKLESAVAVEVRSAIREKEKQIERLQAETDQKIRAMVERERQAQELRSREQQEALRREIAEMEAEIERRAAAESEAKRALLELRGKLARSGGPERDAGLTPAAVRGAVEQFIGHVATVATADWCDIDERERSAYLESVRAVRDWCDRAERALSAARAYVEVALDAG